MRILMVSDVYFPRVNGVSTSMQTFAGALKHEQIEVRLVVPRYAEEAESSNIIRVRGRRVPGDREDRLVGWHAMHEATLAAARDCDLVHIQTPFVAHYAGLRAARQLGLPVLATYHTLFEEYLQHYAPLLPKAWLKAGARALSRSQCNALDGIIVPSSAMLHRLGDYGVTKPMHVLPTGIPLAQFAHGDGAAFRDRHGIPPQQPLALYVGRIAHEKNIGFLFQALHHARRVCPDALLLVAGEGPAQAALHAQAEQLGLSQAIRFLGYLDRRRELPDCYAAADVFAFASRTETQGLVLLEAMAAGLPVIALAEMGTADILAPGKGSLIGPDDPRGFGDLLGHYLRRPSAWAHLRQEAPIYAREWSDGEQARRLAALYRALHQQAAPALDQHPESA